MASAYMGSIKRMSAAGKAAGFCSFYSRHAALQFRAARGELRTCKRFDNEQFRRIPAGTKTSPNSCQQRLLSGLYCTRTVMMSTKSNRWRNQFNPTLSYAEKELTRKRRPDVESRYDVR